MLWVPKTCVTWADALRSTVGLVQRSALAGPVLAGRGWDDLRLVGLKLVVLIVFRAASVLGLSQRESWWKDAEILILRHQLAVAQGERPAGYGAPLAPRHARAPARPPVAAPAPGPAADRAIGPRPGAAAGPRESRVGVPPGAWRAAGAQGEGRGFHRLGDPA